MKSRRTLLAAALFASIAPLALAQMKPLLPDPAHPAIGEWVGAVSWNSAPVSYAWSIYPDGTFSSGRLGRGQYGGGAWGTHGVHLSLKYSDGFRYEGDLKENLYTGTAYTADGRVFGGFLMSRDIKHFDVPGDDGD